MSLLLAAALSAHAATFTAEDLVRADARSLPSETTARIAESVATDGDTSGTSVYLLRRGVPAEAVRAWGFPVTEAEANALRRLGSLDAPPPAAPAPWVDPRALADEIHGVSDERRALPSHRSARVAHARRGGVGTGAGALLLVAGSVGLMAGTGMVGMAPNVSWATLRGNYGLESVPTGLNPALAAAGAVGVLAGGVTLSFGARELRLAGPYPGGWMPAPEE